VTRKTGRNEPCPCGSGKKYKKCCLGREESESPAPQSPAQEPFTPSEQDWDAYEAELQETEKLAEMLEWKAFDFGVDLFDPLVLEICRRAGEQIETSAEEYEDFIFRGLTRHLNPRVRAGFLDELESRVPHDADPVILRLTMSVEAGLSDMLAPPLGGLAVRMYQAHLFAQVLAHEQFRQDEMEELDHELADLMEEAGRANDAVALGELAERLPRGEAALPYIDRTIAWETHGEEMAPLVEILEASPCQRSVHLLCLLLYGAEALAFAERVQRALASMSDIAWPVLLERLRDRTISVHERMVIYDPLVDHKVYDVFRFLVRELEHCDAEDADFVADKMVRLGDRRAIGAVVELLDRGALDEDALGRIRAQFTPAGWWEQVEHAIEQLKLNMPVLIREGTEPGAFNAAYIERAQPGGLDAAQFEANMASEAWNTAYHEDLDWLRPADLLSANPKQEELMRAFGAWVMPQLENLSNGRQVQEEMARLQQDWMITPQRSRGGRAPQALILSEQRGFDSGYSKKYVERRLSELYQWARFDSTDSRMSRYALQVVLDVDPGHVFAQRLLRRMA